jgi:hypothetical protein
MKVGGGSCYCCKLAKRGMCDPGKKKKIKSVTLSFLSPPYVLPLKPLWVFSIVLLSAL